MLKDFLYLKEKNLKDVIELLLKAYTSSFSDSEQNLKKRSLGKAHHRLIVLIDNNPGIKVTEILNILKITKQSLNRVLRDLINSKMIKQIKDESDTRKKNLFLDKEGKVFFETVYNSQKKRIFNALKNSNSDSVIKFKEVLKRIVDGK